MMKNTDPQSSSEGSASSMGRLSETEAFYSSDNWYPGRTDAPACGNGFPSSSFSTNTVNAGGTTLPLQPSTDDPLGAGGTSCAANETVALGQGGKVVKGPTSVPGGFTISTAGELSGEMHDTQERRSVISSETAFRGGSVASVAARGSQSSRVLAQVQQFQAYAVLLKRKLDSKTKPWAEFFRFSSFDRPPATPALVADRVDRNLRYFFFNYAIVASAIVAVCLLTSPFTLAVLCISGILSTYVSTQGEHVQIGTSTYLPAKQAQLGIAFGTCFCLLFSVQVLFAAAGSGLVLILIHACLHYGKTYEEIRAEAFQSDYA